MKMFRLLTAVYFLGILPQAYAVSSKFQEVKIGLWIDGVEADLPGPIALGEHEGSTTTKITRALPEELSVVIEDKF